LADQLIANILLDNNHKIKNQILTAMSISKTRSVLYKTAKVLGDIDAVKKGKVGKRVKSRLLGKLTGKLLKKL
jgi:hypothetical protein